MNNEKVFYRILIAILFLLIVSGSVYFVVNKDVVFKDSRGDGESAVTEDLEVHNIVDKDYVWPMKYKKGDLFKDAENKLDRIFIEEVRYFSNNKYALIGLSGYEHSVIKLINQETDEDLFGEADTYFRQGYYTHGLSDENVRYVKDSNNELLIIKSYANWFSGPQTTFDGIIIVDLSNDTVKEIRTGSTNYDPEYQEKVDKLFNQYTEEYPFVSDSDIVNISNEIIKYLQVGDLRSLKKYMHPIKGARITINGYIREDYDIILKPSELDYLLNNNTVLTWGYSDGKGEPINLGVKDFFKKYFSHDYSSSDPVLNENRQGGTSSIDNITKSYPNKDFVNYYIPYASTYIDKGIEKPQTLDWHALNLVFEEYQGKNYLIGIVKDNWTI